MVFADWPRETGLWLAPSSLSFSPRILSLVSLLSWNLDLWSFATDIALCIFPILNFFFSLLRISLLGANQTTFSTCIPPFPPAHLYLED